MKSLLILILFPMVCLGQSFSDTARGIISHPKENMWIRQPPKQDTIAVMMLCTYNKSWSDAWSQKGYVVSEIVWHRQYENDLFSNPTYLDLNKKPMSKEVIVWMSKETNPSFQ